MQTSFFNKKYIHVYLSAFFLFLLIFPFLYLTLYNYPTGDDYTFNIMIRESSGLLDFYRTFFSSVNGRYLTPVIYGIIFPYDSWFTIYKILSLFFIILFVVSIIWLVKKTTKLLAKDVFALSVIILYSLFLYLPQIPEFFYWINSTIVYLLPIVIFIMAIVYGFKLFIARVSERNNFIFLLFVSLILPGLNETISVTYVYLLGALFLSFLFSDNISGDKKYLVRLAVLILITMFCLVIVYLTPSTAIRMQDYNHSKSILFTIHRSFVSAIFCSFKWALFTPLIPLLGLYVLLLRRKINIHPRLIKINFILLNLVSFGIIWVSLLPPFWAFGYVPFVRALNIPFIVFILMNSLVFFTFWQKVDLYDFFEKNLKLRKVLIVFFALYSAFLLVKENKLNVAYGDIFKKRAVLYYQELLTREEIMKNSKCDTIQLQELENIPHTLIVEELREDPTYFYNRDYAKYYNKKAVFVLKNDERISIKKTIKKI